ncbi:Serine/Threonine kinase domain protein (macronuclear) [Tetrahymena thermophila SB210]|uniref:Serine/Threonine kinase domain protein n=1 Tax=Tetrahymena thermophila (strain SB210) TaxID=312017 RepID=I7LWW4_TETTS|nr:Serine/Threonine kinase domain protein [Tetrahymena thermophila SB210]EAS02980.2 Serine/Threonine kinase domain protein [Tetrahymena thermophila SB210]|eukprot:XP_001023225.2 Serine/Threonine kinase domain protein [Tetrahymena thermophila SB210]
MQIDQRKKLELLDYRMRHPSTSPIKTINNFANIKQKLNGIDIYKNNNEQLKDLHDNEEDDDDKSEQDDYLNFDDNQNNQGSLDFMNKNLSGFNNGGNFLYCTPPVKINNNYGNNPSILNNPHLIKSFNEENNDLDQQNSSENNSDEEEREIEEDENVSSNNEELEEDDSNQDQQESLEKDASSQQSIKNEKQNKSQVSQIEKSQKQQPPQKAENFEPTIKKVRVLNSQKILFQENTFPNENEKPINQQSGQSGEQVKKTEDIKNIVNQIGLIQVKNAAKNNNKTQKKISKITDYLNQDQVNKNANNNNMFSKSTGNSNNTETEQIQLLNRELKEKEQQLNQKQKQIENLENLVGKLKQSLQNAKSTNTSGQNSLNPTIFDHSKIKRIVQKMFTENSFLNRKLIKMQLQQSKQRLGEYVVDLQNFKEQWIDGFEVQELYSQLDQVQKKIKYYQNVLQNLKTMKPKKKTQTNGKQQKQLTLLGSLNDPSTQANSNQDSNSKLTFEDEDEFDTSIYPNQAVAHEEQKRFTAFQITLLQKQEEVIVNNLNQKKKEVKEIIKKYQLQFLEENSRYGGIQVENPWPILGERYQLLSLLGKGGFSEVYKAIDLEEFREVAIKIHYIDKSWSNRVKQNYLKHAFREHGIQKELNHPNIVKLYDYIEIDSTSFASVLQFCEGPDLSQHLKIHSTIIEQDAKYIVKKILECLEYLSSFQSKVIHYDLKPQNIIFHKGQIKITDFGLSKIIEDNATRLELTSQGVGTYWYLPPECFENFGCEENEKAPTISNKVDIWSVGVIFYEMLFGQKPFGNKMTQEQILRQNTILNSKEVKFPKKPLISKEAQSFIIGCLKHNQEERFDVKQALNHPYFKKA